MEEPDFQDTLDISSLSSARQILRVIIDKAKTVQEILDELEGENFPIKYRASVFKSLEKMVSAGLVKKIKQDNSVRYQSPYSSVTADFIQEKLYLERERNNAI